MRDTPLWEDTAAPAPPAPPLSDDLDADLVVVGLGGSGLAAVEEGLEHGLDVVGIDAGEIAGRAAGRNGGFLLAGPEKSYHDAVETYGREVARAFYLESLAEIDRMLASDPEAVLRTGSLRVATAEGELDEVRAELDVRRADGFDVEPYRGAEGEGFLVPTDAAMNPLDRCRRMAGRLAARGARLFGHTPAVRLDTAAVRTPEATVRAPRVVVAVDGGLERIVPALAGRVRTARLQMLGTEPLPEIRFARPVYAEWGFVYWQQRPDGRLAIGGGRQRFEREEWTDAPGPSDPVQAYLDGLLERLGVRAAITHRWAGHSAYTIDRRPVFEEIRPGMVAVGAYSGHGNVAGALYGREAVRYLVTGSRGSRLLDG